LGENIKVLIIEEGADNHKEKFAVSPIGNRHNIYDAVWIKKFNGGTNYHQIEIPKNVPEIHRKPYRVISSGNGYVGKICDKKD
jgi:hypothetical protein